MGYISIIIAILIWSSLGVFVRKTGLPTVSLIFYPAVVAGLFQLILLSFTGQIKNAVKENNSINNLLLLILVPVFFLANTFFFFYAFKHTTIAKAVLTHYTAPIFVAFMAPFFLKEKNLRTTWLAILLSSIGLWFIISTSASGEEISFSNSESRGIIAGVLSGFSYAFLILIIRSIASKFSSLFIIFIQNVLVAVFLLPFIFNSGLGMQHLPYIVTLGVVHSTIAPFLYVRGFKKVKANEAAILGYFEPVGAIILALIFLHEVPGMQALLGGILILYSGFMVIRARGE